MLMVWGHCADGSIIPGPHSFDAHPWCMQCAARRVHCKEFPTTRWQLAVGRHPLPKKHIIICSEVLLSLMNNCDATTTHNSILLSSCYLWQQSYVLNLTSTTTLSKLKLSPMQLLLPAGSNCPMYHSCNGCIKIQPSSASSQQQLVEGPSLAFSSQKLSPAADSTSQPDRTGLPLLSHQ